MLDCRIKDRPGTLGQLAEIIGQENINIKDVVVERDKLIHETIIRFDLEFSGNSDINNLNKSLLNINGLIEFKWH
ncbi:MAG: ACT domain-containing protein [Bacillota bacterium]